MWLLVQGGHELLHELWRGVADLADEGHGWFLAHGGLNAPFFKVRQPIPIEPGEGILDEVESRLELGYVLPNKFLFQKMGINSERITNACSASMLVPNCCMSIFQFNNYFYRFSMHSH